MYYRPDARLIGNSPIIDELEKALSRNGVSVSRHYAWFPQVGYPYVIIEILRSGVGLGNFALLLLLNALARKWLVLPWLFITYREAATSPTEWTIQGTPDQVMRQIRQVLWWNVSCPYCRLPTPLGRYCDKCGNRLFQ